MNVKFYNNIINKYIKTGYIRNIKPQNLAHAKRIAYKIATQKG